MNVTRCVDAKAYEAPFHHGCAALRLQGAEASTLPTFWVGVSHFLPGGGADWDATNAQKVYVVVKGQVTIETESEKADLGPGDSVWLAPGDRRRVMNLTNMPASMLVVASSPR